MPALLGRPAGRGRLRMPCCHAGQLTAQCLHQPCGAPLLSWQGEGVSRARRPSSRTPPASISSRLLAASTHRQRPENLRFSFHTVLCPVLVPHRRPFPPIALLGSLQARPPALGGSRLPRVCVRGRPDRRLPVQPLGGVLRWAEESWSGVELMLTAGLAGQHHHPAASDSVTLRALRACIRSGSKSSP